MLERERGGKKSQCFCRIFPIYFNALYACQTLPYLMHFNATWADTTHITRGFIFIQLQSNNSFNFCRIMQILQSCVCMCVFGLCNYIDYHLIKNDYPQLLSILTMRDENSIKRNRETKTHKSFPNGFVCPLSVFQFFYFSFFFSLFYCTV